MRRIIDLGDLKTEYVICSCEGAAEEALMDILLDNNCLLFSRENLVGHKVTRKRKAVEIQQDFLNRDYSPHRAIVVRILDSRSEKFKLSALYAERHDVYTIRTTPEIEMLLIIAEGKAAAFRQQSKSKIKPSEYCKSVLKMGNRVKSRNFWLEYFVDINMLLQVIRQYHQTKSDKSELSIYDLLKEEYR